MVRRRRQTDEATESGVKGSGDGREPEGGPEAGSASLNEVVAYNFKRAREMNGWTQDECAERLARFLGVRLPQASISGIERGYMGRPREFDAQEVLAFACCFDLPLIWFFIPPPGDHRQLRNTSDHVNELYSLLLGREDQLELLYTRFRELGMKEPTDADNALEAMSGGTRSQRTMWDYRTRRKDLLINLLDQYSDAFDKAADEMGSIFDRLRQLGLRAFVSSSMNDRDYGVLTENRGRAPRLPDENESPPGQPTKDTGDTPRR